MPKLAAAAAAVAAACILAGCGNGAAKTADTKPAATATTIAAATTTTAPAVDYKQKYLAIIGPLNSDIGGLNADPNPTQAQLNKVAADLDHAESQFLAVHWPAQTEAAVQKLVQDVGQMAAALENDDPPQIQTAGQAVAADSAIVRADLGLPSNQ